MKNKRWLWISIVVTAVLLISAFGYQTHLVSNASAAGQTPVGTWTANVTPNGAPPFKVVVSFHNYGTLTNMEADGRPGIGTWQKIGGNTYAFTMLEYWQAGGVSYQAKVNSTFKLSKDGEQYYGPSTVEVRDQAGNVIFAGDAGDAVGQRMHVEPMQ